MWVSEGFIQPIGDYGQEDIATEYYRELIKRNLIEPTDEYSLTGYRCSMHDVVRSFAERVAKEESMVVVDKEQLSVTGGGGSMLVRRLSIGHTTSVLEWSDLQRQESLRTLIINSPVKHLPTDSLDKFCSLRVLYICSADSDMLVASLSKLKHLRYLYLKHTDISRLPDDINKMKFLRYIFLLHCEKLGQLPNSIVKLLHLRSLNITGSNNVSVVPRGFCGLTNLRILKGFPVHVDMDAGSWCSLQELAPLSQLRELTLYDLEKVPCSWMAEKVMISSKVHLSYLLLNYSARGQILMPHEKSEKQQQQSVIKEVLEKLCPPDCLQTLIVEGGYVGSQLPKWMCAPVSLQFKNLRYLRLDNLPFCTQLPNGLCCMPSLELLTIKHAPVIRSIGSEFQASSSLVEGDYAVPFAPFPKLRRLQLKGLCEWEEWQWNNYEEQVGEKATIAMPCLETLTIDNCKLSCLPPGLANSKRHTLRKLNLHQFTNLAYIENFASVVKLDVVDCPELKRISGPSRLQKIRIVCYPNLQVLEGVPTLDSLVLEDDTMETLPEYLTTVKPRYLKLDCHKKLHESLSLGSSEWNKICHIEKHNINCIGDSGI